MLRGAPLRSRLTQAASSARGQCHRRRLCTTAAPNAGAPGGGGLFAWYRTRLVEAPLSTNALTAASLGAVGDAVAQYLEYVFDIMSPGKCKYNWGRTYNMAAFGLVAGPIYGTWYRGLDVATRAVIVESNVELRLVTKVVADSVLAGPAMLHLYYGLTGLMEGRSVGEIVDTMRSSFYKAWGLGVSVWVPAQFFNFNFAPVYLQPVVVATVDTTWKLFLS